jgi:hypothetical protein
MQFKATEDYTIINHMAQSSILAHNLHPLIGTLPDFAFIAMRRNCDGRIGERPRLLYNVSARMHYEFFS